MGKGDGRSVAVNLGGNCGGGKTSVATDVEGRTGAGVAGHSRRQRLWPSFVSSRQLVRSEQYSEHTGQSAHQAISKYGSLITYIQCVSLIFLLEEVIKML